LSEKASLAKGIALVLALLAVPLALTACGGGAPAATSSQRNTNAHAVAAKTPPQLCQALNAVLADGPDPGADPVGYALSQILPLQQQVHSSDAAVMATVHQLVAADQAFYDAKGDDKPAAATIQKDYSALNRACPGVAP
jgi:hypothetical protein